MKPTSQKLIAFAFSPLLCFRIKMKWSFYVGDYFHQRFSLTLSWNLRSKISAQVFKSYKMRIEKLKCWKRNSKWKHLWRYNNFGECCRVVCSFTNTLHKWWKLSQIQNKAHFQVVMVCFSKVFWKLEYFQICRKNFLKNFMALFHGWGSTVSRLEHHYKETVYFLSLSPEEFLVLI